MSPSDIYELMPDQPKEKEKRLIEDAYQFAEAAHEGQKRASGAPYFTHVVETAKNLARYGMDATTIAAGLLHDTIEDTETTEDQIKEKFGDEILNLVNGVTKLGKLKYKGRERHVESLRKFFIAIADDFRVLMIKLADRLHNLQTLQHIRPEKQKRIAMEAIDVYAPLANRLGIGKLKGELEDAAFPYAYPKEYAEVNELLKNKILVTETNLLKVKNRLEEELVTQRMKNVEVSARMKHKYSLWKKLERSEMDIDKVYDIIALRIIVKTIADCYKVLGIVHSIWRPLPNRIKDYIALPKLNGYQSLHTTIFTGGGGIAEIQIRTHEMHNRAEYGIASHYAYKDEMEKLKTKKPTKFQWVKHFKDLGTQKLSPDKFMENLKMDITQDRIFVFTPEGDVIDLPEESSPIDFAYAVHTDIGFHTQNAKVNGKMVTLGTKLENGDIVEINTNKKSHPTSKWMDYAKTTLARKHIKVYLDENSLLNKYLFNRFK